jgi:geranylgeranyl diphosphate synthase type I
MIDQSTLKNALDQQIRLILENSLLDRAGELNSLLAYQMGMDGESGSESARGKRLRPLLLLYCTHAVGGRWEEAISSAAAVEMLHNFSLIHDDIQDKSELRRGRPTVWVKWGMAQAINAGDALLGMSQLALLQDAEKRPQEIAFRLFDLFNRTLVKLTIGQYFDLAFEKSEAFSVDAYDDMVAGKTGALLAACFEMGSILGGAGSDQISRMAEAGRAVGRAFQIQDDWLGIWGIESQTGKSALSDLLERKKTYPVIRGIAAGGEFTGLWRKPGKIGYADAIQLSESLIRDGIKDETEYAYQKEYERVLRLLQEPGIPKERIQPLVDLIQSILHRMK